MHILNIKPKLLIGQRIDMCYEDDQTFDLWRSFMPFVANVPNAIKGALYSVQVYPAGVTFFNFTETTIFTKWAAIEVTDLENVPEEMDVLELTGGMYLVEEHIGTGSSILETYDRIFNELLPSVNFNVDHSRPNFEVLGHKYKNNDATSREDIWIPISM